MDNTLILFLGGGGVAVFYGLLWITRKKDGGPIYGYTSSWDAMAPFAMALGIVVMLISVIMWLAETSSP